MSDQIEEDSSFNRVCEDIKALTRALNTSHSKDIEAHHDEATLGRYKTSSLTSLGHQSLTIVNALKLVTRITCRPIPYWVMTLNAAA